MDDYSWHRNGHGVLSVMRVYEGYFGFVLVARIVGSLSRGTGCDTDW